MNDQALIVRDDGALAVQFTNTAIALKNSALERAALIARVSNADEQREAVGAQQDIAHILNQVEKARKAAKEPILDFGRRLDDAARKFVTEIKDEQLRVAKLVGDFQKLEEARVRAAELARIAEQRRLEEERRAAEQAAMREAEIARKKLADEAAAIARAQAEAKNAEDRARVETARLELERQKALAEAESHDAIDRIQEQHNQAIAALPVAAPVRVEGQRVRQEWVVEVTDIWLLARAHPGCVKIEPRLSEIKSLLDAGVKVAGVSAKRETKSGVTGARPRLIDV